MVEIDKSAYIAPGAVICGDVKIEENCSVYFNTTIRADNDQIRIGKNTNIQDNCALHTSLGSPVIIEDCVSIGHGAIVHGCTVKHGALIGMGAIILDDAVIGENAIIGAGALVTKRTVIPPNSLAMGVPAKVVRELNQSEINTTIADTLNYVSESQRLKVGGYEVFIGD